MHHGVVILDVDIASLNSFWATHLAMKIVDWDLRNSFIDIELTKVLKVEANS